MPLVEDDLAALDADEQLDANSGYASFHHEVWHRLSQIDVDPYVKGGAGGKQKLNYLPWADAWRLLMEAFPESFFEFDPVAYFENQTAEVWITVTIKEGAKEMNRRWWLPIHQAVSGKGVLSVEHPSSMQINNTRMRLLVKALAMCGLGTFLYAGEDVPTGEEDKVVAGPQGGNKRSTSARSAALDGVSFTRAELEEVDEWSSELRKHMPDEMSIDYLSLDKVFSEVQAQLNSDQKIELFNRLESWQRTALKKIRDQRRDKQLQQLQGEE